MLVTVCAKCSHVHVGRVCECGCDDWSKLVGVLDNSPPPSRAEPGLDSGVEEHQMTHPAEPPPVTDAEAKRRRKIMAWCDDSRVHKDVCPYDEDWGLNNEEQGDVPDCTCSAEWLGAMWKVRFKAVRGLLEDELADRARDQERIGELEAVARKWLPGLVASLEVPDA